MRAHFYFELVKRYGGVTLVGDQVYDLNDDIELPRNTFAQCIDYIVRELDEIKMIFVHYRCRMAVTMHMHQQKRLVWQ